MPVPDEPAPRWGPRALAAMLSTRRGLALLAACAAVGGLLAAAGWKAFVSRPAAEARMRYETVRALAELYGLQNRHREVRGVYASGLESLLALAPDGAAMKARMAGHLDLATLAVVGDARGFKLEANVLDAQRTLIKLRGPVAQAPRRPQVRELPIAPGASAPLDGAPIPQQTR